MKTPTVHLNGTSRQALLDGYSEAHRLLEEARKAMAETAPNGRDYYPQGPDAIRLATIEHGERMAKIEALMDDLMTLYCAVEAQG